MLVPINISDIQLQNERNMVSESIPTQSRFNSSMHSLLQCYNENKPEILKHIARRIGEKWRALARELGIQSGTLDIIEDKYPNDLQERIYKVLETFDNENSGEGKVIKLCKALREIKRIDLAKKVEKFVNI